MSSRAMPLTCILFMHVITLAGVGVAVGFGIANYIALHPVSASATASASASGSAPSAAMVNAATVLVQGTQPSACAGVQKCPPGDIACEMCQCFVATTVTAGAPDPCTVTNCVCDAIISDEETRTCARGAPLDKCVVCQLIPSGQCAPSPV